MMKKTSCMTIVVATDLNECALQPGAEGQEAGRLPASMTCLF